MNIVIYDPYFGKFTSGMKQWWESNGHQVKMSRYYDPQLVEWADLLWFDTCDNNLASATNPGSAIMDDSNNFQPWDLHDHDLTGKRVVCRPIDIEVWQGAQHAALWDLVDEVIFIAPHIRALFDIPLKKEPHVIPCGVDLSRYRFAERGHGYDIAIVSEKWTSKGTDLILQVALKLKIINPNYRFHWLGRWSDYQWEQAYFNDFISHHGLSFEFTEWIEGDNAVDDFLEGKNYLLHASHKEGYSYAVAEAMAKGIKPVVHRFYGADDLWPNLTWDSIDQAVQSIAQSEYYDSAVYRQYLIDHGYTLAAMMQRIDEVIQ